MLGAAAGTGVQGVTKRAPAQLSAESTLSFRLETPLTLQRVQSAEPDVSQGPFSSNNRPVLKQRSTSQLPDTEPPATAINPFVDAILHGVLARRGER